MKRVAVLVTAAVAVAGCAAAPHDLAIPSPTTASVGTTPAPATATPCPAGIDALQSYAPDGPLPEPGQMPAGTFMRKIYDRGHLVVGGAADVLQFGACNPLTGRIEGFDVDMAREVARAIFGDPDRIEYKVITYAQRIPKLRSGEVDIVAHTMTINCTRWAQISFSSEYYHAGQKVLVRTGSRFKTIQQLASAKARVCVARGSTNIDNLAKYAGAVAVPVDDLSDCLVLFQQGKVDAITGDDTVLVGFQKQDPYAQVVGDEFSNEPYGLGIAKGHPEFVRFVNAVLEKLRSGGKWASLYTQWVGGTATPPVARYGRPLQGETP